MPGTTNVGASGRQSVDGLLIGVKWSTNNLTFSFPTNASDYSYYEGGSSNFGPLSGTAQAAVRQILQMYSSVANVTFSEVSGGQGDLRYADTNDLGTAFAFFPSSDESGGDVWFEKSGENGAYYDSPRKGDYAYFTYLHETGHALGLKHGHETSVYGALPSVSDSVEYSVMTYRSYIGASPSGGYTNEFDGFPQSLMVYDIAALQYMYGANYNYNSGDTIYSWSPTTGEMFLNGVGQGAPSANRIFQTIWDGGGADTFDFSNYSTDLSISLDPGNWSRVSTAQLAQLGEGKFAVGNISTALLYQGNTASLIENATGGTGNDEIHGNSGDNLLIGGRGDDLISGTWGFDTLLGGEGNDELRVFGLSYGDFVQGGAGQDVLRVWKESAEANETFTIAGTTALEVRDGEGRLLANQVETVKMMLAGGGENFVDARGAGPGRSVTLEATLGTNTFYGGAAGDVLNGGSGNDFLDGGSGNDTISGGAGHDMIFGGTGRDSVLAGDGSDEITITGLDPFEVSGEGGTDLLRVLSDGSNADQVFMISGGTSMTVRDGAGLRLADLIEQLELNLSNGTNLADARGVGGQLGVTLIGGTGTDTLYGSAGNDALLGGNGNDVLDGSGNDDTVFGGDGADTITGGHGNDTLDGGTGNDLMRGGIGDDTYVVHDALDNVAEASGEGTDTVTSLLDWTLGDGLEFLNLANSAVLGVGNSVVNEINGNGNANWLDGKGGADIMRGGAGDDTYVFETVGDHAHEAAGDGLDTVIIITAFSYTLTANVERLWLGGSGDFQANGNDIDNEILGNAGNNILNGGLGADTMYGGQGNDLYIIDNAGDVVSEAAGEGTDTVNSLIDYTLNVNVENLNIIGTGNINAYGSNIDNVVNGNTGNNTLTGEAGNDTLNGGDGLDNLVGGSGNDTLAGGIGADRLEGGSGNDLLIGGDGDDLFVFGAASGHDTIQDFTAGAGTADRIDLSQLAFADFAAVLAATTDVGGSAVIALSGADDLTLTGVLRAQLHENDFLL